MDCKEYLNKYRHLALYVSRLEEQIEITLSRAKRVTAIVNGMPAGSDGSQKDEIWAAYMDVKDRYQTQLRRALHEQRSIEQLIQKVPNDLHRLILEMRYIDCLNWADMAERLRYTCRHVHRLHGAALEELRPFFEGSKCQGA